MITWAENDAIGIYMVDHGAATISMNAVNKQYRTSSGDGQLYEAIILPRKVETYGDVTVEFLVGSDRFVWTVPAGTEFKTGEEHTWEITLTRTEVKVTASIEPWKTGLDGTEIAD